MSRFMDIREFPILNDPSKGLQRSIGVMSTNQLLVGKISLQKVGGFLGW